MKISEADWLEVNSSHNMKIKGETTYPGLGTATKEETSIPSWGEPGDDWHVRATFSPTQPMPCQRKGKPF
jgi:hypothetical protein